VRSRRRHGRLGPALILSVLVAGLLGWVVIGALRAEPPAAEAQDAPAVEIHRVQRAGFLPRATAGDPLVILALGSDARPDEEVNRRLADSIHLISVNPALDGATILGFPRDSYVEIPGVGTAKINDSMFYGGPELVVETIQQITGITVDYYLLTSFEGIKEMVDQLGGLEVEVPYAMNDPYSGAVLDAGLQTLDGKQTLAFSRNRHDTPNGDFSRSENQGLVLLSALRQLTSEFEADPTALFRWIAVGMRNIQTDLTVEEILDLGLTAVQLDPETVTNLVAPGSIGMAGDASVVFLGSEADAIYADMKDDGLVGAADEVPVTGPTPSG
jgi:LCP family protein required for cell wall assembly